MTTIYTDVSHHDWNRRGGNLDWRAVRAATSEVMCARATYGDPLRFAPPTYHFGDFQRGAQAAGFTLRGGYHNLVRGDTASMRRQVDWFRRELDAYGCHWAMLDIERYKELVERDLWPRFDDVRRFRDAWHAVESRPLAYYLPKWLWSGYYGGADLRQLPGPLVQSHYLSGIYGSPWHIYNAGGGDSGTGWDDWYGNRFPDVWQYSATCDVAGASAQTDVNAFRGTVAQLRAVLIGDEMEQTDKLIRKTVNPDQTVGDAISDLAQERHWRVGASTTPVPGDEAGEWPKQGSPDWILANLPELLKQHASAPIDPAVFKAMVREALTDPAVLAGIAKAVNDDAHRRSAE